MTREKATEILWKNRPTSDPRPCGMELCDAVDMAISALRQEDHFREVTKKVEPLTNAQKIRAMTDEELAWELMLWRCEAVARHHGISSEYPDTQKTILEWLQQPSGEEDKHEDD